MVHQLFALTLQFGAISAERCWAHLNRVPDFSGITHDEFEMLIQHLIRENYLFVSGGLLSLGNEAEKVFGRKNFMELYAVFSSPVFYRVKTEAGYEVGSLEQSFVDTLVSDMSSFLLGGRAWTVSHINHADRTIRVIPAPRGKKPSWGGFAPQLLGYDLCQQIAVILLDNEPIPYINDLAQHTLAEYREDLQSFLHPTKPSIQNDGDRLIWWTFAGGQINSTLRYGLQFHHDWKITCDNFRIKIEGNSATPGRLVALIETLRQDSFWNSHSTKQFILEQLPEYRLSKFQRALPEDYSLELISNYLLNIPGSLQFLAKQNQN